jgi:hypothetical protein
MKINERQPRGVTRRSRLTSGVAVLIFSLAALIALPTHGQTATPVPNGSFPRIGSVWWGENIYVASPSQASQIQLFLGPNFTSTAAIAVKTSAPNTPMLLDVNAMETVKGVPSVPSSYFLLDTNGNQICDWPGSPANYILNLTNPAVAQYVGQYAAGLYTQNSATFNGVFFDNLIASISNKTTDCYGKSIQISSQGNGVADNPAALDAAWSAGVMNVISTFRSLAPGAYTAGHGNQLPPDPRTSSMMNADIFGFDIPNIREGTQPFGNLWDTYQEWFTNGRAPVIASIQSSPPNQIAYGYGYTPTSVALPQTVAFGQTFYPNMRFGLATTLMNDGFFIHDFGDVSSPVTWWYDEYNFNLGKAVAPAQLLGSPASASQTTNGGFEGTLSPWKFTVVNDGSVAANLSLDSSTAAVGQSSAHINVISPGTVDYHVNLEEDALSLTAGAEYQVQFWAKSDIAHTIKVVTQGGAPSYSYYGLCTSFMLGTTWNHYSLSFTSSATANDTRLEFFLGGLAANVWLDDVQLIQAPTRIYRRDFEKGVALVNATNSPQTISLESGLSRFSGSQAPRYQYIVDDSDSSFSTSGSWIVDTLDTGLRKASGPYYHAWKGTLHELDGASGSAQWNLNIPADGQYTLQVWLPAAPAASTWTQDAVYQVMAGGTVLGTEHLNQSNASQGDQWFNLGTFNLSAAGTPSITVQNNGSGPLIADGVYVFSTVDRYNDGAAVSEVTIPPMDGILLQRQTANQAITFAAPGNQVLGSMTLNATASSGLAVNYVSNSASVCQVSGDAVNLSSLGSCSITASQPGGSGWTAAVPVTQTFGVFAPQTISVTSPSTAVLGTAPISVPATATSGLPVTLTSMTPQVCTASGQTVSVTSMGTCIAAASQSGNSTYAPAATVTTSFSVVAPQTITFAPIAVQGLGALPFSLSATASSGLGVSFASNTPLICTVSGNTVTLLAVGNCSINALQPGSALFAAAAPVTQTFTVVPNLLTNGGFETSLSPWLFAVTSDGSAQATASLDTTASVDGISSVHVAVVKAATASYHIDLEEARLPLTSGAQYTVQFWAKADIAHLVQIEVQGGAPSYAVYGLFTTANFGTTWKLYSCIFTAPLTVTDARLEFHFGSSAGNVWIDDAQLFGTASVQQSISFAAPANQVYGTAPYSLVATATSGLTLSLVSNTSAVCSVSGLQLTIVGVGACSITASQPGNTVYQPATSVTQTFQVAASSQTITFPAPANQTYGVAPFAISANSTSGLTANLATSTPAVCGISGNTVSVIGAGTCSITASQAGNADYSAATPVQQSFAVSQLGQLVTFSALSTNGLGGIPLTLSASATSALTVVFTSGNTAVCTVSGSTVTLAAAGTCSITAAQPGNANYAAAGAITQSFTVMPNSVLNGGFEGGIFTPWKLLINADGYANASAAPDTTTSVSGTASALIKVNVAGTANWHINLEQDNLPFIAGKSYILSFWAKASSARSIQLVTQGCAPSFANYGLYSTVSITTGWAQYTVSFTAPVTATDGRLQFWLGNAAGNVWLDDVQLYPMN